MTRADDPDHPKHDPPRRRGRARPRPTPASSSSVSNAFVSTDAESSRSRAPRSSSSKMKMASLMAVVDEQESDGERKLGLSTNKSKRVKVHATRDDWSARQEPISIQSLTRSYPEESSVSLSATSDVSTLVESVLLPRGSDKKRRDTSANEVAGSDRERSNGATFAGGEIAVQEGRGARCLTTTFHWPGQTAGLQVVAMDRLVEDRVRGR
uniref:Uncharacterized protein n=1 Tax=Peronospora matthiolae TaxID=2874970 RepID=A0AAV1T9X5_9STRA